jgi:hypothetical protein
LHPENEPESSSTLQGAQRQEVRDPCRIFSELLQQIRDGQKPQDNTPATASDAVLNQLHCKDFPALRQACASLTVTSKDKKIDVVFRARMTGMVGTLNLYLDPELSYTWHEALLTVSRSQGHGIYHARNLRTWIHQFLSQGKLPFHCFGRFRTSILEDKGFSLAIHLHLQGIAKDGYVRAQDIVDFVATQAMQDKLEAMGLKEAKHFGLYSTTLVA